MKTGTVQKNYENFRELVATEIGTTKGKISAKRLLPTARADGYAGSDRNFRRLVAQERSKYRQLQARERSRRPAVWAPGEQLVRRRAHLSTCTHRLR